jgi:hypothetical protein
LLLLFGRTPLQVASALVGAAAGAAGVACEIGELANAQGLLLLLLGRNPALVALALVGVAAAAAAAGGVVASTLGDLGNTQGLL